MTLPRFGGFKSSMNGRYLSYTDDNHTLVYSANDLIASRNKFALEPASNGEVNVFNIRCCYNSKYWRPEILYVGSLPSVVATASQPNENESDDRTSTLFKFVANNGQYKIVHVSTSLFATVNPTVDDTYALSLYTEDLGVLHEHMVIDWEALVILPKYIVFKGDNGKYLQGHSQDGHEYLQFGGSDPSAHAVGHEVFRLSDGNVRIKSLYWGKFWKNSSWIWASSTDTSSNDYLTLFTPVKVSDNVIALKNLGGATPLFVKRLSLDYKESCLAAQETTINKYCEMEISEFVSSRSIYNVKFRLKDSRIYGETIEVAATQDATNDTTGYLTQTLSLLYTDEVTNTWNNTLEMKLGFGLEFSGGIPLITSEKITVLESFRGRIHGEKL